MLLLLLTGAANFWPWLASILGKLTTWLLDFHIATVNFLSEKTMLIINFAEQDARVFLLYIIVVLILLLPKMRILTKKRFLFWHKPHIML